MSRRFVRADSIVERAIRGERILVPLADQAEMLDSLYTLNEVAALIWDLAKSGITEEEIVGRITAEYDVEADAARADAGRVLDELLAIGALHAA